jgi:hypothetical protein
MGVALRGEDAVKRHILADHDDSAFCAAGKTSLAKECLLSASPQCVSCSPKRKAMLARLPCAARDSGLSAPYHAVMRGASKRNT